MDMQESVSYAIGILGVMAEAAAAGMLICL